MCPAVGAGKIRFGPSRTPAPTERFVGAGFSCPPLCRPIPGHCRARQSGHFLETGSLHPPLAALRRFPRPRATARVAPTKISEHLRRAACPHAAVMVRYRAGGGLRADRPTILAPCPIIDISLQACFLPHPPGLGDADGQQDLILRVLAAAGGIYPCRAHEIQGTVQAVEKQADIL